MENGLGWSLRLGRVDPSPGRETVAVTAAVDTAVVVTEEAMGAVVTGDATAMSVEDPRAPADGHLTRETSATSVVKAGTTRTTVGRTVAATVVGDLGMYSGLYAAHVVRWYLSCDIVTLVGDGRVNFVVLV